MNQERINDYNDKISDWVAKQGFLFQLRHATELFGKTRARVPHFVQLFVRCVVLVLILLTVFLFTLSGWHKRDGFAQKFRERTQETFQASEVTSSRFSGRFLGESSLSEVKMTGGSESFFDSLKAKGARFNLGAFPVLRRSFEMGSISLSSLEVDLKVSASDDSEAQRMFEPFFANETWLRFDTLETKNVTLRWGYSAQTKGQITGASLVMARHKEGWKASFKGGTFSYGWIKEAELKELSAFILPDSFQIKHLHLEKDNAVLQLEGALTELGAQPRIAGKGFLYNADLDFFLPYPHNELVTGTINTDFSFEGLVDSTKGLRYVFRPAESEDPRNRRKSLPNVFQFTQEIALIRALNTLDNTTKLSRYKFNKTDWTVTLYDGDIEASEVVLANRADDHVVLKLDFRFEDLPEDLSLELKPKTLPKSSEPSLSFSLDSLEKDSDADQNNSAPSPYPEEKRGFRGEGLFSLSERAFLGKEALQEKYPVGADGRREIPFPLKGHHLDLTRDFSRLLYDRARE